MPVGIAAIVSMKSVAPSSTETELLIADIVCVLAGALNLYCFVYVYRLLKLRNESKWLQSTWAVVVLVYSSLLVASAYTYWSEERDYVTNLDENTQLLKVYPFGDDLIYMLKLVNWSSNELDIHKFELVMTNRAAAAHCGKERYDQLLARGGRIIFNYVDKSSAFATDIVLDEVVCLEFSRHGFVIFQSGR
tara:strand:- start:7364 stop:7936 length:573 start_codon:yes stop_codon:yes gene_type:complete